MSIDNKWSFCWWVDERVTFWEIGAGRRKSGKCNETIELLEPINRAHVRLQQMMCVPVDVLQSFEDNACVLSYKAQPKCDDITKKNPQQGKQGAVGYKTSPNTVAPRGVNSTRRYEHQWTKSGDDYSAKQHACTDSTMSSWMPTAGQTTHKQPPWQIMSRSRRINPV